MLFTILFCLLYCGSLCGVDVVVNDNGDLGARLASKSPKTLSGTITLRAAIEYINSCKEKSNSITFSAPLVIQPQTELPPIRVPVTIKAKRDILLVGPGAAIPTVTSGLIFDPGSNGSCIEGLVINNFIGDGLTLFGAALTINSDNCTIVGNYVGVDQTGTKAAPNLSGVVVIGKRNIIKGNLIAGNLLGMSQFYSGNNFEGNQLLPYPIGGIFICGSHNVVRNNSFGLDVTGKQLVNDVAVRISGCHNTIQNNKIAAFVTAVQIIGIPNTFFGKAIPADLAAGQENRIIRNRIGLKAHPVPGIGVHLAYGPLNGVTPQNNLISQNRISGFSKGIQLGAVNTPVRNNRINKNEITNNAFYGIFATNALHNLIDANVISDNGIYGIYLTDEVAYNTIQGNYLGTNRTGIKIATPYFSNWWNLPVQQNHSNNIVENIIVGNKECGLHIASNTTNNIVQGNWIGLTSDGSPLGNGQDGIKIESSKYNLIGGSPLSGTSLSGNSIAYNGGYGVNCSDETNAVIDNQIWGNGKP